MFINGCRHRRFLPVEMNQQLADFNKRRYSVCVMDAVVGWTGESIEKEMTRAAW